MDSSEYNLNKVFIQGILEADEPNFSNFLRDVCNKFFLFQNNINLCAICHFKKHEDAAGFIKKYNRTTLFNSFIKCKYALKKRSGQSKLIPLTYNHRKVVYNNCVTITINYDFEIVDILHFLRDIYSKHIDAITECIRKEEQEKSKNKTVKNEIDGTAEADEDKECDFEIVKVQSEVPFEKLIATIRKKNLKKIKWKGKRNNKTKDKIKKVISMLYTIEFASLNLAKLYSTWINKKEFEHFLNKENKKIETELQFVCELCILNRVRKNVIVKNLSAAVGVEHLVNLFREIDESVFVHIPKQNGKRSLYAFVEFHTEKQVEDALLLNKTKLCGKAVIIKRAKGAIDVRGAENDSNEKKDKKKDNDKNNDKNNDNSNKRKLHTVADGKGIKKKEKSEKNKKSKEESNEKGKEENKEGNKVKGKENLMSGESTDGVVKKYRNDVDEGKTLFITNIPIDTTKEELQNYIESRISPYFTYINMCENRGSTISAFVKLKSKRDADDFLEKIGEYDEEEEMKEWKKTENVIEQFALMRQIKKLRKEKMKKILLNDISKIRSEYLLFKNTYLVIKRAVKKDVLLAAQKDGIGRDKKIKKAGKGKNKLNNNINLLNDNDVNKEYLNELLVKRNLKLFEKKEKLLQNKNFVINPCRIYVRNYPLNFPQNDFRTLLFKHFTPLFMKKYNIKKKEAFKKSNKVIQKMLVLKEPKESTLDTTIATAGKEFVKDVERKNTICFIDVDTHEHAKELIHLLQNRNIYELCDNILHNGTKYESQSTNEQIPINKEQQNNRSNRRQKIRERKNIYRNKDVLYVDYCIEDVRMLQIKKLREERFLKHVEERKKYELIENANKPKIKKSITKGKEPKIGRGKRQREKRRLQKLQQQQQQLQLQTKEKRKSKTDTDITPSTKENVKYVKRKAEIKNVELQNDIIKKKQGTKRKRENDKNIKKCNSQRSEEKRVVVNGMKKKDNNEVPQKKIKKIQKQRETTEQELSAGEMENIRKELLKIIHGGP